MKKLLLLTLCASSMMAMQPGRQTFRARQNNMPANITTFTQGLHHYVPNKWVRLGIAGTAFAIAVTDNPLKKKGMSCINYIQMVFNRANEVTQKVNLLERNIKEWATKVRSVL